MTIVSVMVGVSTSEVTIDEIPRTAHRRTAAHPTEPAPASTPSPKSARPVVSAAETVASRPPPIWDGYAVTVMTAPERCASFHAMLGAVVHQSYAGVLVTAQVPWVWPGGPVVAVQLRRNRDGAVGQPLWLGPLSDPGEQATLCRWLHAGPSAQTVPQALRGRILTRLVPLPAAAHTMN